VYPGARLRSAVPPAEIVREQMDRILSSAPFIQSSRMTRFLRFIVECSLDSRADALKEYLIGVEVFDRKPDYDPRVDPIVRVEARRLRSKLQAYYETRGSDDEWIIELPKGTYLPRFRARTAAAAESRVGADESSIVVLPFANLSAQPENEYFSDGLTGELIHALTKVEGLRVVAWNSAAQLKSGSYDVKAIGRQLSVKTVCAGSVRRSATRVRVLAQLIDTATGHYLWSETYDRELQDLLVIQEEIARAIVKALRLTLIERPLTHVTDRRGGNFEAYNHYLKGRFHWNKRSAEGIRKSVEHFEAAIALEPGFAAAHAGLADAFTLHADYGLVHPSEAVPKAKAAASRALELDPLLAEAYASLGLIRSVFDWEWAEAERLYTRSIELGPGYASAHHWFAVDHLGMLGRLEEALDQIELAVRLDPLSAIILEGKGMLLMLSRRFDAANAQYREVLALDPSFSKIHASMGRNYVQMGEYKEAIENFRKAIELCGPMPTILGAMGQAYGLAGEHGAARAVLEQLEGFAATRYVPSTCFALVYLGLGNREKALDWLDIGCRNRELPMAAVGIHPAYDDLRSDPRFQRIVRTVGTVA
jgi:TolB-like protein